MRWTSDTARTKYEDIQARLSRLTEKIAQAAAEVSELELEARELIGMHTLPAAGSYNS